MARIPRKVVEHFRNVPLFSGMSDKGLRAIVVAADEITEPAGKDLVREGEHRRELFVITEGTAKVTRKGRTLNNLGPGDFFGEIALLSGGPRTATVTSTSDVSIMILSPTQFMVVLENEPRIMHAVLQALGDRLRPLDERTLD